MTFYFILFFWLQIKHYVIDYVLQTQSQIERKGVYGDLVGMSHSLLHGVGTLVIFTVYSCLGMGIVLGLMDFLIHYHIDWAKMRYGTKDKSTKAFWNELGLDQLAHQLTYLMLLWVAYSVLLPL